MEETWGECEGSSSQAEEELCVSEEVADESEGSIGGLMEMDRRRAEHPEERVDGGTEELRAWSEYIEMLSGVLVAMKRAGPAGKILPSEFGLLEVFGKDDPREEIWEITDKTCKEAGAELEDLFKCAEKRGQKGERKPMKYLVKKGVEAKMARMGEEYEDKQFISALCREYTCRRGISIYRSTAKKKQKQEIDYKVHEKVVGFCVPAGSCEWEDWKKDEFFAAILK
jgi:Apoptosis-antagonizing transcription factor, C-terminal